MKDTEKARRLTERIWLRCYFAKIPLRGTSDTLGTLGETVLEVSQK